MDLEARRTLLFDQGGLVALRATFAPNEQIPPHDHEDAALATVIRGGMTDEGSGQTIHRWECAYDADPMVDPIRVGPEGMTVMILSFGREWLDGHGFRRMPFPESFVSRAPDCQIALMRFHSAAIGDRALVEVAAIDVVSSLVEKETTGREPGWAVRRAIERLSLRPEEAIARVAQDVGYHPTYLARLFLRETGTTMTAFAQRARLVRAAERVLEGKARLADVALDSGFYDPSHFTRRFTTAFGMSPRRFRKLHKVGCVQVSPLADM